MNQDNISFVWDDLKGGIDDIFKLKNMKRDRYMRLYTQIYNYCTFVNSQNRLNPTSSQPESKLVGVELYKKLREYLKQHVQSIKIKGDNLKGEEMLSYFQKAWTDYRFSAIVLNGACAYLNKNWIKREYEEGRKNVVVVYCLALTMWREYLFKPHCSDLVTAILKEIEKERKGEPIFVIRLRKIIECLVELGIPGEPSLNVSVNSPSLLGTPQPTTPVLNTPTSAAFSRRTGPSSIPSASPTNMQTPPGSSVNLTFEPRLDLSTYQAYVEEPFLNETDTFYMLESRQFLQVHHVTEYLKKIETRMNEEKTRIKNYLHVTTEPKLLRSCEQYLIGDHIDKLTAEFCNLLNEHREEDIWRMYQLVGRFPRGMKALVNIMEEHVKERGLEGIKAVANAAVSDPKLYIDTIMEIQRKYYNLVVSACNSDPTFHQALDKGCERFINHNAITELTKNKRKTPELLAKYIDLSLKKSPKSGTLDDLEDTLQRVMELFKYVEEKDVFLNFYSKFMARRFVSNQSVSEELESTMISKLKESQGFEYTNNLQRLYCEVLYSRELKTRFHDSLKAKPDDSSTSEISGKASSSLMGIDFSVTVLASIAWPFNLQPSFTIPSELEHCYNKFAGFYATVHSGRKLTWCYHHSRGELTTNFLKEKYNFQVSTYQMAVLMLYNDQLGYTMDTIRAQTGIESSILIQVLQILVKARILRIKDSGSDLERKICDQPNEIEPQSVEIVSSQPVTSDGIIINPNTFLELCLDYKNKRLRVNLNSQLKSEVKQEAEQTTAQVDDNRKYIIQACIVRILKARKTMKHQQLVTEIISQMSSKFKPSIALIKQSITLLIDKSYIARSEQERETYEYLA